MDNVMQMVMFGELHIFAKLLSGALNKVVVTVL